MKKTRLRAAQALPSVIASILALGAGPALGQRLSECTTIDKPGSYVLTGSLTAAGDCVVVAADFVTLDLGGWVITGDGSDGSGVTDHGHPRQGIAVRNGTITGFEVGLRLSRSQAVVEKVRAIDNVAGITTGEGSIISGNAVSGGAFGITAGGIISGNDAGGFEAGMVAGSSSIVSGNRVRGEAGILAGSRSTVSGNIAQGQEPGIEAGPGSTISGNTVRGEIGIVARIGSTVSGNTSQTDAGNGEAGILAICPSNVIGNTTYSLVLSGAGCTNIDNLVTPFEPAGEELHSAIAQSLQPKLQRKRDALYAQLRELGVEPPTMAEDTTSP